MRNITYMLIYLNIRPYLVVLLGKIMGDMALLEEVCHWAQL